MLRLEKAHWDLLLADDTVGDTRRTVKDGGSRLHVELESSGLRRASAPIGGPNDWTRLLQFANATGLIIDLFSVSGVYLAMANVIARTGSGATTVSGSGFTVEAAVLGCLGEAVEHCSWIVRPDDGDFALHEVEASTIDRISASQVLGFSAAQLSSRIRLNLAWDGWDGIPPLAELERPQSWTHVRSADGVQLALCPTFLCYGQYGDLVAGDPTLNVDSNGCAAGETRETATTRALLELIERDATGIWWHCGCVRSRIDNSGAEPMLHEATSRYRDETGRRLWFLDISTFANAAVVVAVSCEPGGADLALGFGADFNFRDAVSSAFLELIQSEIAIEAHLVRSLEKGSCEQTPADRWMARWRRSANMRNFEFVGGGRARPVNDPPRSFDALVDEIEHSCGGRIWFANLTREEFATPVIKAICEGLGHYKLRRRSERYFDLPRSHGWQITRQNIGRSDPFKLLI